MKPLLDAIALRIALRLPIDAHMRRAATLISGASSWSILEAAVFEQERRALIDHVLVAGRSGGEAPEGRADERPPSGCAVVTGPPSSVNDAALLNAIVDEWDAILRTRDEHAELRDGVGATKGGGGKRKRGSIFSCAKCGRGPFASTDAVRKHARNRHPDWITGLTPSVFARFDG